MSKIKKYSHIYAGEKSPALSEFIVTLYKSINEALRNTAVDLNHIVSRKVKQRTKATH